jgi:hypothetical protein
MPKDNLTNHSKRNLAVIENFILFLTHCSDDKEPDFTKPQTYTPEELYRVAFDYIQEDHVDGEDSEEAEEERNSKKYIGRVVKIIDNLDDHNGYNGEDLTVISVEENSYLTVENKDGKRWNPGIEETNIED